MILVESALSPENGRFPDRLERIADRNIGSVPEAEALAEARLRKAKLASISGSLVAPLNCGQQLYDVVAVTEPRAGLDATPRRVLGITLVWHPAKGEYSQKLQLGAV